MANFTIDWWLMMQLIIDDNTSIEKNGSSPLLALFLLVVAFLIWRARSSRFALRFVFCPILFLAIQRAVKYFFASRALSEIDARVAAHRIAYVAVKATIETFVMRASIGSSFFGRSLRLERWSNINHFHSRLYFLVRVLETICHEQLLRAVRPCTARFVGIYDRACNRCDDILSSWLPIQLD